MSESGCVTTRARTIAPRPSGSLAGSRERYHKLFDEVFTYIECRQSHLRATTIS